MMCEQTGQEIDWEKCPPELQDFPNIVIEAINIYNSLGNKIGSDVGFTGKDYTNLNFFIDVYGIEDVEFFLEILALLASRAIKKSSDALKREYDKIKRKT